MGFCQSFVVEHAMGTVKTLVGSEEQLGALAGFSWDIPWDSPSPPGKHGTEGPEEQLGALVGFSWISHVIPESSMGI